VDGGLLETTTGIGVDVAVGVAVAVVVAVAVLVAVAISVLVAVAVAVSVLVAVAVAVTVAVAVRVRCLMANWAWLLSSHPPTRNIKATSNAKNHVLLILYSRMCLLPRAVHSRWSAAET